MLHMRQHDARTPGKRRERCTCRKRSRSSRRAVRSTSRNRSSMSPVLSAMALPEIMRKAAGLSGRPRTSDVKGETPMPPVLRPMRSVSWMKLSRWVPICVSDLPGTMSSQASGLTPSPPNVQCLAEASASLQNLAVSQARLYSMPVQAGASEAN